MDFSKYIESVPNVGPQYNVGLIVRDLLGYFVKVQPNHCTPRDIAPLLSSMDAMASDLRVQSFTTPMAPLLGTPMPGQWRSDLDEYRQRLATYIGSVEDADPENRKEILEDVTIPLFFGTEGPQGLLRGADIRTVFQLANGLMVSQKWREEWLGRVWESIKDVVVPAIPQIPPFPEWPPWTKGLAVIGGAALLVWTAKTVGSD
jgi:hypothetical protein